MKKEKTKKRLYVIAAVFGVLGFLTFFSAIFVGMITFSFKLTPYLIGAAFLIIILGCAVPLIVTGVIEKNQKTSEMFEGGYSEVVEEVKNKTEKQISKKCQYCGKKYKGETDICPHCGAGQE